MISMLAQETAEAAAEFDLTTSELMLSAAFFFAVGVALIPVRRALERKMLAPTRQPKGAFAWSDLWIVIALLIVTQIGLAVVYATVTGKSAAEFEQDFIGLLILTANGFGLVSAYIFWRASRSPHGRRALGVKGLTSAQIPFGRSIVAIGTYIAFMPFIVFVGAVLVLYFQLQGIEVPTQDVAEGIDDYLEDWPVLIPVLAVLVVPLFEEVIFRGFLLELLVDKWGRFAGVVLSSWLFAILHGIVPFLPIFVLALALATIKLRTRSLLAVWLIHAVHNGVQVLLTYFEVAPV